MNNKYGICPECDCELEPVMFLEREVDSYGMETGRVRNACDYLICPYCGKKIITDGVAFNGPWTSEHGNY